MADGGATNPTPKRRRTGKDWAPAALAALSRTANVKEACKAAGIDRSTFYDRRNSDPEFAAAAERAIDEAVDDLELEARRRAKDGLARVKFHQGQPVMVQAFAQDGSPLFAPDGSPVLVPYTEHEYSDTLMIFLLKAHRPDKYRERREVSGTLGLQHSGEAKGGASDKLLHAAAEAIIRLGLAPGEEDDPGDEGGGGEAGGGDA